MASKLPFFVEGLDGRLINLTLVQSLIINPNDDTNLIWIFRNGATYEEDLVTAEEAANRLEDLKSILLGSYAELVDTVTRLQQQVAQQAEELETISLKLDQINNEVI